MGAPFRVGLMQLTMEPLADMLATARALDRGGFDTIWLAEAYPWWRKHSMEGRSATASCWVYKSMRPHWSVLRTGLTQ